MKESTSGSETIILLAILVPIWAALGWFMFRTFQKKKHVWQQASVLAKMASVCGVLNLLVMIGGAFIIIIGIATPFQSTAEYLPFAEKFGFAIAVAATGVVVILAGRKNRRILRSEREPQRMSFGFYALNVVLTLLLGLPFFIASGQSRFAFLPLLPLAALGPLTIFVATGIHKVALVNAPSKE